MSDPFLDDESGPESSQPRELYEIVQSASVTYRIASGDRDVDYDGNTYTASPAARTEVGISTSTGEFELTLTLPLSHGLSQRYNSNSSPPRQIAVTIYRKQLESGLVERIWSGYVTSMAIAGNIAKFRVPSKSWRTFQRQLPSVTVGKLCPHILYDSQCRADPDAFHVGTTVISSNGRTLRLTSLGSVPVGVTGDLSDDTFLPFGQVRHVPTGEIQTIFSQTFTVLNVGSPWFEIEMQAPIPDIKPGDLVEVYGGCDHGLVACYAKFANMANFGGFPELPGVNLFIPGNGVGIYST